MKLSLWQDFENFLEAKETSFCGSKKEKSNEKCIIKNCLKIKLDIFSSSFIF